MASRVSRYILRYRLGEVYPFAHMPQARLMGLKFLAQLNTLLSFER
jgi:hypothetical protein